jgi:hypothetical protein
MSERLRLFRKAVVCFQKRQARQLVFVGGTARHSEAAREAAAVRTYTTMASATGCSQMSKKFILGNTTTNAVSPALSSRAPSGSSMVDTNSGDTFRYVARSVPAAVPGFATGTPTLPPQARSRLRESWSASERRWEAHHEHPADLRGCLNNWLCRCRCRAGACASLGWCFRCRRSAGERTHAMRTTRSHGD